MLNGVLCLRDYLLNGRLECCEDYICYAKPHEIGSVNLIGTR